MSLIVTVKFFICNVELKQATMTTTYALRQSTHQFLPFGIDFSKKDDHLGVYNSRVLEDLSLVNLPLLITMECNNILEELHQMKERRF